MADKRLQIVLELVDKASQQIKQVGSNFENLAKKGQAVGAAMSVAGAAVAGAAAVSIKAFQEQERAETKLETITKQAVGATEAQIQALKNQASALQNVGVIGDEVTLVGQAQLATFGLQTESIDKLTAGMLDLAVNQKGVNATQEDLMNIANLVGKAMDGQVGALSRVGISFTEAQGEIIKTGTEMERAAVLSEVLGQNVGGLNEAMRSTSEGGMKALKNSVGDLMETIGGALVPVIQKVVDIVTPVVAKIQEWSKNNPKLFNTIVLIVGALGGLMLVLGPILLLLPTIIAAFSTIAGIFGSLSGVIPIVVGAFAAIAAVIAVLAPYFQQIKDLVMELFSTLWEYLKPAVDALLEAFRGLWDALVGLWNAIAPLLLPVLKFLAEVIGGILLVAILLFVAVIRTFVIPAITLFINAVTWVIQKITAWIEVIRSVMSVFSGMVEHIRNGSNTIQNTITSIFSSIASFLSNWWANAKAMVVSSMETIKTTIATAWQFILDHVGVIMGLLFAVSTGGMSLIIGWFVDNREKIVGAVAGVWDAVRAKAVGAFDGIKSAISATMRYLAAQVNKFVGGINKVLAAVPGVNLQIPTIPAFAKGGVVNKPTIGLIGEDGPEAVVPLNKKNNPMYGKGGGGDIIINWTGAVDERSAEMVSQKIWDMINREGRQSLSMGSV